MNDRQGNRFVIWLKNTDTYDAGLHMNLSGAEKLSVYLDSSLLMKLVLQTAEVKKLFRTYGK